jgi:hypothetical protein
MALAAVVQAGFTIAIFRAASAQAKTADRMYALQKSLEDARSQIELIPALEMPDGAADGIPLLSVANATSNGCRVLEAQLVLERITPEREQEQQVSKYCAVKGTGVIPGFGELRIDLHNAIMEARFAVWKGGERSCFPGLRLWATIRYAARDREFTAQSQIYRAEWVYRMAPAPKDWEPPTGMANLKLDDKARV